jgi:hypothetical protein
LVSSVLRPPFNGKKGHQIPKPLVTISGDTVINAGGFAMIAFTFEGIGPFTLVYKEGDIEKIYSTSSVLDQTLAPNVYWIRVNPQVDTQYTLISIEDSSALRQKVSLNDNLTISVRSNFEEIMIVIDGKPLPVDVPPQIINDRIMAPLRVILEALGATVEWDSNTQIVTATKDNVEVALKIGDPSMLVNSKIVTIDQPAIILDGRTLIPLRFVADAFGAYANWDGDTRMITIRN